MTTTAQRLLPNFVTHESVKLLSLQAVRARLGVDEDSVLSLIEGGQLPWAFNIGAGSRLREVRVLAASLAVPAQEFATLDDVIDHIILPNRTGFRAGELRKTWNCSQQTLVRLVDQTLLKGHVNGHTLWIEAGSAREFLKRRRIT